MKRLKTKRVPIAALAAIVLLVTACGQKPGVHETAGAITGGATNGTTTGPDTGVTPSGDTGGDTGGGGGGDTGGDTGGGGGGGTGAPTGGGGGGNTGAAAAQPSGAGDRTGVTAKEIVVGIHSPVSGAAPFPAEAFAKGRSVYWDWSGAPKIGGRKVKILFEDDQYNPTTARDRCRKMAEQQKAFVLVGGGGTDQIQSCAQYAATKGIPYLSAGVTEIGVANLPNYFAVSMSYKQQGELLWQMIMKDPRLKPNQAKVAMVRTDTPNFDDAHQGFLAAANKRGKKLILDRTLPKNPSQTDYNQMAQALAGADAQVVYILTAPTHYVQLTARLAPTYRPWWIGAGISKGLNAVLETGCQTSQNAIDKALFFSPFPGVDKIDSLDPNYKKAYREMNSGDEPDDLGIALWGLNKTLHQMLNATVKNLTRQNFISTVQSGSFKTNVFPALKYTQANHFGANQVHVLKANCSQGQYVTEKTFVSKY